MSGGSLDYSYQRLNDLADDIERYFVNDGKYKEEYRNGDEDDGWRDRIGDATPEQRVLILAEVRQLIEDLRRDSKRAKTLEWYLSGDLGADSYLARLAKII
jgi:hypothetical protein